MRISAPLLALVGTVGGTAAAVVAFQATAGPSAIRPASSTAERPAAAAATTLLPCEDGWTLQGEACVKVTQRVVEASDVPAPAASSTHVVPVAKPSQPAETHAPEVAPVATQPSIVPPVASPSGEPHQTQASEHADTSGED